MTPPKKRKQQQAVPVDTTRLKRDYTANLVATSRARGPGNVDRRAALFKERRAQLDTLHKARRGKIPATSGGVSFAPSARTTNRKSWSSK